MVITPITTRYRPTAVLRRTWSKTTCELSFPSADLAVGRTYRRAGDDGGNVALVGPAVTCAVLDEGLARSERDLDPVVKLDIGLPGEHDEVVDRGRGVHPGVVGLEVPCQARHLLLELSERSLDIEIRRGARATIGGNRDDSKSEAADRREVALPLGP